MREILHKFSTKFWDFWKQQPKSSRVILMKFWENCQKILKKMKKNWEENYKNKSGKLWKHYWEKYLSIRGWRRWYLEEILDSSSEIISTKLRKLRRNPRKISKQYRKYFPQCFKKTDCWKLRSYQDNFRKNLRKIEL